MTDLKRLLDCRLFLLDMDGTLYLGDEVFPGAVEFIRTLRQTGRQYIYLTNNSSRAGADYIPRLRRLGFPCEAENVFTSGMATALYLNQHDPGKPVYLVGTRAFRGELERYGVPLTEEDAEIVKECLRTLFVNDASAARPEGSMEVVKLFWWRHNCKDGQYSSARVHRTVKVALKDTAALPDSVDDYTITLEPLEGLTPEIIDGV